MSSLFPVEVDTSEASFVELYRQCDIDARTAVLVLMRALTNPAPSNWMQVGSVIADCVARLDRAKEQPDVRGDPHEKVIRPIVESSGERP